MSKPTLEQRFSIRNYERGAKAAATRKNDFDSQVDMELVRKRRKVEETIEARRQLEELGIFL